MALLGSSWFDGFIGGAKYTGKKITNKLGKIIPEMVSSFISGWDGQGWKLFKADSATEEYTLEIDNLTVRKSMRVYELIIQKIRAVCGALGISQACGQVSAVKEDSEYFYLTIDGDETSGWGGFMDHDLVRCQRWTTSGLKGYWVEIESVDAATGVLKIAKSQFDASIASRGSNYDSDQVVETHTLLTDSYKNILTTPSGIELTTGGQSTGKSLSAMNVPAEGDDLVQYGNTENEKRRTAIYLHADENSQPAMDILFGIQKRSFAGCLKVRLGGGLPESDDVGLYCKDGHILAVNDNNQTLYEFTPSGSFSLGNGKIKYDSETDKMTIDSAVSIEWTPPTLESDVKYALTSDGTNKPSDSEWKDTVPKLEKGKYLWTRTQVKFNNDSVDADGGYSYSVTYIGTDGADGADGTDGTTYLLIPDYGNIVYNPNDKTFSPKSVEIVTALKIEGTTQTDMKNKVYMKPTGGISLAATKNTKYTPIVGDTRCEFYIVDGQKKVASVGIPVIEDGTNGEDGKDGDSVRKNLLSRTDLDFSADEYRGTILDDGDTTILNATTSQGTGVASSDVIVMKGNDDADVNAAQWDVTDTLVGGYWYVFSFYVRGTGSLQTFIYPDIGTLGENNFTDGEANSYSSDANHTWTLTSQWVRHYQAVYIPSSSNGKKYILFRVPQGLANTAEICLVRLEKSSINTYSDFSQVRGHIANSDLTIILDNATIEDGNGIDGVNCVMVQGASQWENTNIFYERIESVLVPNTIYTLSFYVKSDYEMLTKFSDNSVLATDFTPLVDGSETSDTTLGTHTWASTSDEWVQHTYTFKTASAIPSSVRIYFTRTTGSGTAGTYVRICQMKLERGTRATAWITSEIDNTLKLPTWVKEWGGHSTKIGSTYVVTPQAFFGEKNEDGTLTGILMGNRAATINGVTKTGLFGITKNEVKVAIDPVNSKYEFRGKIIADEGQFFGMTYGSVFKSSARITSDNFSTYFQEREWHTPNEGEDSEMIYVPNYYRMPTILVFASLPTELRESDFSLYLPPYYYGLSTDSKLPSNADYELALSLLGTTFVIFDEASKGDDFSKKIILKGRFRDSTSDATNLESSLTIYITKDKHTIYLTLKVTEKGLFYWEYTRFTPAVTINGTPAFKPGVIQPLNPGLIEGGTGSLEEGNNNVVISLP